MIQVGFIVESNADTNISDAIQILHDFNVPCVNIPGPYTHSSIGPQVKEFERQGGKVMIIGLGNHPDLLQAITTFTTLPIIQVPHKQQDVRLLELPLATVAIDGFRNAALLAVSILAISDIDLRNALKMFRMRMKEEVENKDTVLQSKLKL